MLCYASLFVVFCLFFGPLMHLSIVFGCFKQDAFHPQLLRLALAATSLSRFSKCLVSPCKPLNHA